MKLKTCTDKAEVILFSHRPQPGQHDISSVKIGSEIISLSENVRDLGVVLDSRLSFEKHVSSVCRTAYYDLRRISSIRRYLAHDAAVQIII